MFVFVFSLIKITNLVGNKKNMILFYNKFLKITYLINIETKLTRFIYKKETVCRTPVYIISSFSNLL